MDLNRKLMDAESHLKTLNLIMSDYCEDSEDQQAVVEKVITMFFDLKPVQDYFNDAAAIDEGSKRASRPVVLSQGIGGTTTMGFKEFHHEKQQKQQRQQ